MAFPTVSVPVKSPHLDEFDYAQILDPTSGYNVPLLGVVTPDANGNTTLPVGAGLVSQTSASQVTGKRQLPQVGPSKIPTVGLVSLDPTTGLPGPFAAGSATKVTGKFASSVLTGTGASQSVAHGLGVTPTAVLISIYNTNGVALPHAISEGVHTSTNVVFTATANVQVKVLAFA